MAFEPREGSAALFKNKKQKDSQPDWRGDGMLNGELIEISGWDKATSNGSTMLSLNIKPKQAYAPKQEKTISDSNEDDLDIPF